MTAEPPEMAAESIDLHSLLAQFTALRHEVNLQTKAVRAQQEQNAQTLATLQQALAGPAKEKEDDDAARSQIRTLIEIHDALALAAREAKRVRESVLPSLAAFAEAADVEKPRTPEPRRGFFARIIGSPSSERPNEEEIQRQLHRARQAAKQVRSVLESLVTGYTMSVQRLERALQQHELEPIPCVGAAFDPERMEALEIVSSSGRPSGEVIDEVRRGYSWRGRVFRHAQVRVAMD
jgi:molecular chaperone GrpE